MLGSLRYKHYIMIKLNCKGFQFYNDIIYKFEIILKIQISNRIPLHNCIMLLYITFFNEKIELLRELLFFIPLS